MNLLIGAIALILAIMALASKRVSFILRLLFCGVIAYQILSHCYSGLHLWTDVEYTQKNLRILFSSGLPVYFALNIMGLYFVFYGIIVFLLRKIFDGYFKKYINRKTESILRNNRRFMAFIAKYLKRYMRKLKGAGILAKKDFSSFHASAEFFDEIFERAILFFAIILNFTVAWFSLNLFDWLISLIILISIVVAFLLFFICYSFLLVIGNEKTYELINKSVNATHPF